MTIQERLKKLKIDPLFRMSLNDELSKSWQRNNRIKLFLAREIIKILKEIYEPLGMWDQNPKSEKKDIGVIIDGDWSPLMQSDTNYSCHTIIFNRCNRFLVNLYRIKGLEEIIIDDEVFSYKNQIIFNENDTESETIEKIKKILKIVRYKKNEIFLMGCPMYYELIELFNTTMGIGDKAQKFYEENINDFFDDIVNYTSTKGRGDYNDRKEGIDLWLNHKSKKTTHQIKSICNVEEYDDNYFLDVSISQTSRCDYYVFVCTNKRIIIFENNKSKIEIRNNGVSFPKELLHKQKFYNG
jgi:hypothetical protein